MMTQERLKELLHYCPDTGVFTNRVDRATRSLSGNEAGSPDRAGYLQIKINEVLYKAHRLAFLFMVGEHPLFQVDHINGVKDDNRWLNLRVVTPSENAKNRKKGLNNKSGIVGVYWREKGSKWVAQININGKQSHLGHFEDFFEACCTRKSADIRYGYHENHGRR